MGGKIAGAIDFVVDHNERRSGMKTYFPAVRRPIRYEGPDSKNPLAFRWYDEKKVVRGKTMAEHLRFSVAFWHTLKGSGADMFGPGAWTPPVGQERQPDEAGRGDAARGLRVQREARRTVLVLPRPRHRTRGAHLRRVLPQPRPHGGPRQEAAGRHGRQAPLGHGQPLLQSPLHPRRRHQSRPARLRLRGRAGASMPWTRPRPSAASTTSSGAVARATRRFSTRT